MHLLPTNQGKWRINQHIDTRLLFRDMNLLYTHEHTHTRARAHTHTAFTRSSLLLGRRAHLCSADWRHRQLLGLERLRAAGYRRHNEQAHSDGGRRRSASKECTNLNVTTEQKKCCCNVAQNRVDENIFHKSCKTFC